jgi:hypothetical protein
MVWLIYRDIPIYRLYFLGFWRYDILSIYINCSSCVINNSNIPKLHLEV